MYTTSKKRKHRVDMVLDSQKSMRSSGRKKKKSESSGIEHEDKLDKLIEQYRSRFSAKPEDVRQVSRGVKKWFMTYRPYCMIVVEARTLMVDYLDCVYIR